jgi:glyoxylase-like metal-dependent hydrolase (beta-lactamase superfamily II)
LAKATGAQIVYGPGAKPNYDILNVADGESLKLGKVEIELLHTPGHTLESSCFLLKDSSKKPYALFSGDTVFLNEVGRPDLAVKAGDITEIDLAGMLYDSIQKKIMPLADDVIIFPSHGAGSSCGKNISKGKYCTLGN